MSVLPADLGDEKESELERVSVPLTTADVTSIVEPSAKPVVVTEQEVMLATAAAIGTPLPRLRTRSNPFSAVIAGWHRLAAAVAVKPVEAKRHYPARTRSYYEDSIVARESGRL